MVTRIQKWGNSQGIRFPVELLKQIRIKTGDEVDVVVHEQEIIVKPTQRVRGKYNLADILPKKAIKATEIDWSKSEGKEIW